MSPRTLRRILLGYALLLGLACGALWSALRLDPQRAPSDEVRIVSLWRDGQRSARHVVTSEAAALQLPCGAGCTRSVERVVDEGPLPATPRALFAVSVVAGRDGIHASLGSRSVYLTPEDLLAQQATKSGARVAEQDLRIGLSDPDGVLERLASELGVTREAVASFAYELDAISGELLPGYSWRSAWTTRRTTAPISSAPATRWATTRAASPAMPLRRRGSRPRVAARKARRRPCPPRWPRACRARSSHPSRSRCRAPSASCSAISCGPVPCT